MSYSFWNAKHARTCITVSDGSAIIKKTEKYRLRKEEGEIYERKMEGRETGWGGGERDAEKERVSQQQQPKKRKKKEEKTRENVERKRSQSKSRYPFRTEG